ncbi:unnamed protein product [Closterium sp. NIES-65]|nr:unnamed protein product [Closterium sp. NIES-65]
MSLAPLRTLRPVVARVTWASLIVALLAHAASVEGSADAEAGSGGMGASGIETGSSNVWVVLVGSSRNWLNYRDNANTLALYRSVRDLGVSDERIILMLADNMPCNPRNPHPGRVFHSPDHRLNLYGEHVEHVEVRGGGSSIGGGNIGNAGGACLSSTALTIAATSMASTWSPNHRLDLYGEHVEVGYRGAEVDYRGAEVTVDAFLRLLTGRHDSSVPRSKRLLSDGSSRILIYLTGHGGDKFLKFRDKEELQAQDLADAFHHMHQQHRWVGRPSLFVRSSRLSHNQQYHSILLMIDTCQAQTLYSEAQTHYSEIYSPGIVSVASSAKGEMSYSYLPDLDLGVTVVDLFTYHTLQFLHQINARSNVSLASLFESYDPRFLMSTPGYRSVNFPSPLHQVPVTDYVASVMPVQITPAPYPLSSTNIPPTEAIKAESVGGAESCAAEGGGDGRGGVREGNGGAEEARRGKGLERGMDWTLDSESFSESTKKKDWTLDSAVMWFGDRKHEEVFASHSQVGGWALMGLSVLTLVGAVWGPWRNMGMA